MYFSNPVFFEDSMCSFYGGRDWRYGDRLVPEEVCVAVIVARGRCLLSPVNVARGKKIPQRQDGISQDRPILSRQLWLSSWGEKETSNLSFFDSLFISRSGSGMTCSVGRGQTAYATHSDAPLLEYMPGALLILE